jgi:hypothetical protein
MINIIYYTTRCQHFRVPYYPNFSLKYVMTSDAAVRLLTVISNTLKTNKSLHMIFLDVAKAYNSAEHWSI